MRVVISARGLTVSESYRSGLTRRLERLDELLPKILDASVVLSREKHRRTARVTLRAKHRTFRSEETAGDLARAVDAALDALRRQVRDVKDRLAKGRQRRARREAAMAAGARDPGIAPMAVAEPGGSPSLPEDLVIRQYAPKPMSVGEAVAQLRLDREPFVVFTNARTEMINVLYRRPDGGLGLIEPLG